MTSVGRRPPGSNGGDPPASGIDPELAEMLVAAMRSSGVDVAEARQIVRDQSDAIARRLELEVRKGPPAPLDYRIAGEANRLRQLATGYTASPPAAPSAPRARGAARSRPTDPARRIRHLEGKHIDRYRAKLVDAGQVDADPDVVPARVWDAARAAATPAGARKALAELPRAIAAGVRRAVFGEKGAELYTLEERIAVVVTVVVIWKLARSSRMPGVSRTTTGIPRRLICAIVGKVVRGRRYELGALFATRHRGAGVKSDHRGPRGGIVGDWRRGECGYVVALEQCGVLWRRQPPNDVVAARELGPARKGRDGRTVQWAFTQYRFIDPVAVEKAAAAQTPTAPATPAAPPPATAQPP